MTMWSLPMTWITAPCFTRLGRPRRVSSKLDAMMCDLRFMAEDAVLMTAFSQRGLVGEWGISWLLPRLAGTAVALDLLFSSRKVTGAEATLAGTFRFHGAVAHLTGDLKMDQDISHTATGFKSVLLKPLAPFFRKKNAGAVVPIAVTGTPGHYSVTQDITHSK